MRAYLGTATLAVIFALAGCGPPTASEVPGDVDSDDYFADSPSIATHDESVIQFQFDWPVALAVVHYESAKERRDGSVDRTVKACYQLAVTQDGGSTELEMSDFELLGVQGKLHPNGEEFGPAYAILPTATVSDSGRALRATDLDAMRRAYLQLQDAALPEGQERAQPAQAFVDAGSRDESLSVAATNTWTMLVANFVGMRLRSSEPRTTTARAALPLPGAPVVDQVLRISVQNDHPCGKYGPPSGCVLVKVETRPKDPDELSETITNTTRNTTGDQTLIVHRADVTSVVEVVTIPDTLQPYRFQSTQEITVEEESHGKRIHAGQTQTFALEFDWR